MWCFFEGNLLQVLWAVEAFPSINIKLLSLLIMEAVNFLQQVNEQGKTTFLSPRSESSLFESLKCCGCFSTCLVSIVQDCPGVTQNALVEWHDG